jgi:predicted dehydrogenase
MPGNTIRLGTIGFGGFAQFAIEQFLKVPSVELAGLAGTQRDAAFTYAREHGIPPPQSVEELVARDDIDVIYIATPPHLHHPQAMLALSARKHVICEKPLALNLAQADEMIDAAHRANCLLAPNLMQRYNPLADAVSRLIQSKALGEVLHGYFENYASDEGLSPEHWFWDPDKSGGIFIEHGVHFFDLVGSWLGAGTVAAAQRTIRPTTHVEEQVHTTVRYGETVLFDFFHSFTQASHMDRQELRLLFERGDVTLHEWVPRWGRVHALVSQRNADRLIEILPDAHIVVSKQIEIGEHKMMARHRMIRPERMVGLTFACSKDQQALYSHCLREMLTDQLAWIEDRSHPRIITEQNGWDSLALAVEATRRAGALANA